MNIVLETQMFEFLKNIRDADLYSIKFKAQKNIRILFSIVEYSNVKYAILLHIALPI